MRKSTKAALATGAGVALLAGVGGTFAQWSESQAVGTGDLTSGKLDWTVAAGSWSDVTVSTAPEPISDVTAFRMVPGDTLEYTTTVTPSLVGDNLTATLTATVAEATGSLADDVTITADVNNTASNTMALTPASTTAIPVTITVAFPFGDTDGETEVLDLASLTLKLDQNANPAS